MNKESAVIFMNEEYMLTMNVLCKIQASDHER